jgi:uncharacterized delta-60 repeat protein
VHFHYDFRKRRCQWAKSYPKTILLLLFFGVVFWSGAKTLCAQSALDGFDPNANGTIRTAVIQTDGKILIGGDFTSLSPNGGSATARNHIARLNADGTLDSSFNPDANGVVYAIALQADGKILVGGVFFSSGGNSIGGQPRNFLARLDPVTGAADSFNPNPNSDVLAIAVQNDGKILVGGDFNQSNGRPTIGEATRNNIARLDPTTGLADSFAPDANNTVSVIVVQSDDKILVGGAFTGANSIGGQARYHLARLDVTSGLADSFAPNPNGIVHAFALQADGKVLVGGEFFGAGSIGGQTRGYIARLDGTTGAVDSFNPNANGEVDAIAVQADGKILAGGLFTGSNSIGNQTRSRMARLDPGTGLADSFNPGANGRVLVIVTQADAKIIACGQFLSLAPNGAPTVTRSHIARLDVDGRLDQTLDLNVPVASSGYVFATAVQPDGKLLIGGRFNTVLGVTRNNIARLNRDGTLDTAFDPNVNNDVFAIAVQPDGKIVIGGAFSGANSVGNQTRNHIARLDATTGVADSFNPNASATVYAVAIQANFRVVVGGAFAGASGINGQARTAIARLNTDGTLDTTFDASANGFVNTVTLQPDGKILAGGFFNSMGGQPRRNVARLDTSGVADSFAPDAKDVVHTLALQADGKVLVGGEFSGANSIGGQTRNYIARVDATNGVADSFDPTPNSKIYAIAVQADGKILVGGDFNGTNSIGGASRNYIARLDPSSAGADSFDPNANGDVYAIGLQADGKILVGGTFHGTNISTIGGQARNYFARLSNDTAALRGLAVTQSTITWTQGGSSPVLTRVSFESSTDNVNYTLFGNAAANGNIWTLTGLNLPAGQNVYIRARGYYRGGYENSSESILESVRNIFLPAPASTPTPTPTPTATPLTTPAQSATPTPTATATPLATATGTPPSTPTATPASTSGSLGNVSTRLQVGTGNNVLFAGFIVQGNASKTVLIRSAGPSLSSFGVPGALSNPQLELHDANNTIGANDNWQTTQLGGVITSDQVATIQNSGAAPSDPAEPAIIATLPAGGYTAIVQGVGGTQGVATVEVYDLSPNNGAILANISTRGFIQTGDNVMIGGFIVVSQTSRVLVRATGPSLIPFGINNALANPRLELHDANGALAMNDDWQTTQLGGIIASDQSATIQSSGLAPGDPAESAIIATLAPGAYTAIAQGVNGGTGVGLVEVFALP